MLKSIIVLAIFILAAPANAVVCYVRTGNEFGEISTSEVIEDTQHLTFSTTRLIPITKMRGCYCWSMKGESEEHQCHSVCTNGHEWCGTENAGPETGYVDSTSPK